MLKNKLLFLALFTLLVNPILADENPNISIKDAWISEAPPNISVLAAYAHIHNLSAEAQTLLSVASPDFSKVEIHLSKIVNETAKMEKQEALNIPANSALELTPGAYHLMLFDPNKTFESGDTITLNFSFSDDSFVSVPVTVRKRNNKKHKNNHEHHHHH